MSLLNDWNAFFGQDPGTVVDLGNGSKVTLMHDGSAIYQDSSGAWVPYTQNDNPYQVAQQAPGLQQQWGQVYSTSNDSQLKNDFNAFFGQRPGSTITLPHAKVTLNADGTATYQDLEGKNTPYTFDRNTPLETIAQNAPLLGNQWTLNYGFGNVSDGEGMGYYVKGDKVYQKRPTGDYEISIPLSSLSPEARKFAEENPEWLHQQDVNKSIYATGWQPSWPNQSFAYEYLGQGDGKMQLASASRPGGSMGSNLGMGGAGGSGGSGSSSGTGGAVGGFPNPYQPQMFNAVTQQVTENLNRNILPGLRSAATATGGFGGSRQGVVEANALKDANQQLSNSLANIQYSDWNNYQNRLLQNKGLDNSYNLGLGQLDLGYLNANNSFYTAQRGQDLQQLGLGAQIFGSGVTGMLGQGQGIYNLGLTGQQAPWQVMTGFGGMSSPYTGFGSTTQNNSGSPAAGFLGGAIGAGQLYNIWSGNSGKPAGTQ